MDASFSNIKWMLTMLSEVQDPKLGIGQVTL